MATEDEYTLTDFEVGDAETTPESAPEGVLPTEITDKGCYVELAFAPVRFPQNTSQRLFYVVPSDYHIFALDFESSFPAQIRVERTYSYGWFLNVRNLHGRGRPTGTIKIKYFAAKR